MRGVLSSLILAGALVFSSAANAARPADADVLAQKFAEQVDATLLDSAYAKQITDAALVDFVTQGDMQASQYFLLVDRNPAKQAAALAYFDAEAQLVEIIGASKASTGSTRRGHFETPVGMFPNVPANPSYRALGTKNRHGWRGLGARGSRVWDLGWQRTLNRHGVATEIRMLVHATDPDQGEPRLGSVDSKGCVRISAKMNHFLDHYGILDAEYVRAGDTDVLPRDREPVSLAGSFVVVVDSSQ